MSKKHRLKDRNQRNQRKGRPGGHGGPGPGKGGGGGGGGRRRGSPRPGGLKTCPMCGATVPDLGAHIRSKHDDAESHPCD